MDATGQVLSKKFESLVWIRPEGRGTFQISPAIKEFGESQVAAGERHLVIDLEACTGMDSTFMGMLAGLGMLLRKKDGGRLCVLGTSVKTRALLEELGLGHLMEIEPESGPWLGKLEQARAELKPLDEQTSAVKEDHILNALVRKPGSSRCTEICPISPLGRCFLPSHAGAGLRDL